VENAGNLYYCSDRKLPLNGALDLQITHFNEKNYFWGFGLLFEKEKFYRYYCYDSSSSTLSDGTEYYTNYSASYWDWALFYGRRYNMNERYSWFWQIEYGNRYLRNFTTDTIYKADGKTTHNIFSKNDSIPYNRKFNLDLGMEYRSKNEIRNGYLAALKLESFRPLTSYGLLQSIPIAFRFSFAAYYSYEMNHPRNSRQRV